MTGGAVGGMFIVKQMRDRQLDHITPLCLVAAVQANNTLT